jgi:hypothetical protein
MTSVPIRVLLQDLFDRNEQCLQILQELQTVSEQKLTVKKGKQHWSALECVDHMLRYLASGLPKVRACLTESNLWLSYDTVYKATIAGDYLAKVLLPNAHNEIVKSKARLTKKPKFAQDDTSILLELETRLLELKEICSHSDKYDCNKKLIPLTMLPIFKLNLGDKLRILIYHNQRHLHQAIKAAEQ